MQAVKRCSRRAVGDYALSISKPGFAVDTGPITIVSGSAITAAVRLSAGPTLQPVTVSALADASTETATPTTLINRDDIEYTPGADRTNSLAMITDFVPGTYFVHDQLHVRGGHQTSWEVDGVEIPNTNIADNLGPQIDPKDIDTLETERGSYEADQGDRTYGVFNVVPKTGLGRANEGELIASGGNFGQTNDYSALPVTAVILPITSVPTAIAAISDCRPRWHRLFTMPKTATVASELSSMTPVPQTSCAW